MCVRERVSVCERDEMFVCCKFDFFCAYTMMLLIGM